MAPDPESYDAAVARLERDGLPVIDHIRGTIPVAAEAVGRGYRKLIEGFPLGVTHFALHCTAPGEIETITPQHAGGGPTNTRCSPGAVAEWCAEPVIAAIGYREIQRLWQAGAGNGPKS